MYPDRLDQQFKNHKLSSDSGFTRRLQPLPGLPP